ncbi:hypothetical protein GCM10012280_22580 [Wenjunlia tyrosinilytica]|uniref:Histidine kinase/HSP90-like ATPase domain-containing protein n=1 Tax=Wenjunlia tyrosinilytica TaxID=1544741 RepID=A0A918DWB3_9ACTN|nr:hypothetical protein GCM10012280_22580 [Wenjunlia tyrosinilytica]
MSIWWTLHLRREAASVPLARRILLGTMDTAGVDPDISYELGVALSEACANAVEHAADARSGSDDGYLVTARIDGDRCRIEVRDSGPGFPEGSPLLTCPDTSPGADRTGAGPGASGVNGARATGTGANRAGPRSAAGPNGTILPKAKNVANGATSNGLASGAAMNGAASNGAAAPGAGASGAGASGGGASGAGASGAASNGVKGAPPNAPSSPTSVILERSLELADLAALSAESGRGMYLIEALADHVQFRNYPPRGAVVSFDKALKWRDDALLKAS